MAGDARSHFPYSLNRTMDALLRLRLDTLKAQLVCVQMEKVSLQVEIACATTEKWKKENAMLRFRGAGG